MMYMAAGTLHACMMISSYLRVAGRISRAGDWLQLSTVYSSAGPSIERCVDWRRDWNWEVPDGHV